MSYQWNRKGREKSSWKRTKHSLVWINRPGKKAILPNGTCESRPSKAIRQINKLERAQNQIIKRMKTRHNVVMELIGELRDEIDEIGVFIDELLKTINLPPLLSDFLLHVTCCFPRLLLWEQRCYWSHCSLRRRIHPGKGLSTTICRKKKKKKEIESEANCSEEKKKRLLTCNELYGPILWPNIF